MHGGGVFDCLRQSGARCGCLQRHSWRDGDYSYLLRPIFAQRDDVAAGADERNDQAAEQRGSDVVGVLFHFGGEAQSIFFRQFFPADCKAQCDAGHDCRGAAAQASGDRNLVLCTAR